MVNIDNRLSYVIIDLKVSDEVLFEELRQNNEKLRFSPRVYTIGHDIAPTKSHGPEKIDYTTSYERQTVLSQKVDDADEFIPNYGIIDKIVLRFSAFLKDPIPEGIKAPLPNLKSTENQEAVIRSVVIDFFLEDDSIRVTEPFVHDSGLPQGTIIRRQMIPKNINIGLGI